MGYTTTFYNKFKLNKPLADKHLSQMNNLRESKHFASPNSSCGWKVSDDKLHIEWDGQEKFYYYNEWLQYIIDNILMPNNYRLTGRIIAEGEIRGDLKNIFIQENKVQIEKFGVSEKKEFYTKKEKNRLKKIGKIIAKSKIRLYYTHPRAIIPFWEFLTKGFWKSENATYLVLIKEKDNTVSYNNLTGGEIKIKYFGYASPLENLSEIVHYNSSLFRIWLKSENVFFLRNKISYKSLLVEIKDKTIFGKIILYKKNLKVVNSSNLPLIKFLSGRIGLLLLIFVLLVMIFGALAVNITAGLVMFLIAYYFYVRFISPSFYLIVNKLIK